MRVNAIDLNDAWRNTMWSCVRYGEDYKIKKGSYEGQIRRQLTGLYLHIDFPGKKPVVFYTPPGIPQPTNEERIEKYFYDYIITNTKCDTEDYTYGQFIAPQVSKVIDILNEAQGKTNQATMNIGGKSNINMDDPPCLRVVDFKVSNKKLILTAFFRSWDIFTGLPENLGGLQLLKEYILMHLNFSVSDGPMIIYSSGAHLYEMYFPIVNQMNALHINSVETKGEDE
jgi:thymidylate synthase